MSDHIQEPVSDSTITPPSVIGAGQTFASVTDKISSIALTPVSYTHLTLPTIYSV